MEEDEPTGYVTIAKFTNTVSNTIKSNLFVRDDEEKIYRAFQTLDTDKKGFLLPDELRHYLTTQGEAFTNEEIDEMLTVCLNPIFYEGNCIC